jgi:hypothetical protein
VPASPVNVFPNDTSTKSSLFVVVDVDVVRRAASKYQRQTATGCQPRRVRLYIRFISLNLCLHSKLLQLFLFVYVDIVYNSIPPKKLRDWWSHS